MAGVCWYNGPMPYRFFNSSEKAWQGMFEAIKKATQSVYLETYILARDMPGFDFLNLLRERAEAGVRVRIILDSFGSSSLDRADISSLRASGAELYFSSHLFHRVHRKILVVDERVAFIGGVNFHERSRSWKDLVLRVGGRMVPLIIQSFAKVYAGAGGKDPLVLRRHKRVRFPKVHQWLIEHSPIKNKFMFKSIYREHLGKAYKNITLVTPYFMPKRWFLSLLDQAVLRGVRVDILVPRTTDIFLIDRANYFYMKRAAKLGVNFYLQPTMNHAKAMLIDGREGVVGSQNLDMFSFELNSEIGILFDDADSVQKLSTIVETWKKESELFEVNGNKPKWFDYILSPLFNLFYRIL